MPECTAIAFIPLALRFCTWSLIKEMSGDTTTASPSLIIVGT